MKYLLLINVDEKAEAAKSQEEMGKVFAAYGQYTEELQAAGHMLHGEALQPTSTTTTTVRVRDGNTLTTDGPYAETKEQLGGFYLIEANDLDEAIKWAAKIPHAADGSRRCGSPSLEPAAKDEGLQRCRFPGATLWERSRRCSSQRRPRPAPPEKSRQEWSP